MNGYKGECRFVEGNFVKSSRLSIARMLVSQFCEHCEEKGKQVSTVIENKPAVTCPKAGTARCQLIQRFKNR